ncbi:hypothetical protein WA1_32330 [Scytonema hofmannii PCC 7110]|jgi:hypothetical protein|uniref:Uncharacterized protein n=1 Tax=Scytonema hofmannii PCC 7110 TaxID=128403 RepID=A0A139X417_9CYAN|nr:hypothetical protein [Scytonema hofmannii]KYC39416.1 hypothetical protein WA1_32330 [Scytonema hofmannii PCC 7110]
MTEQMPNDAPSPEAQEVAEKFSTGIENFQWRGDYFKFCEVLGLTPDDYAESHYQRFIELADALSHFRVEELAKILDAFK